MPTTPLRKLRDLDLYSIANINPGVYLQFTGMNLICLLTSLEDQEFSPCYYLVLFLFSSFRGLSLHSAANASPAYLLDSSSSWTY